MSGGGNSSTKMMHITGKHLREWTLIKIVLRVMSTYCSRFLLSQRRTLALSPLIGLLVRYLYSLNSWVVIRNTKRNVVDNRFSSESERTSLWESEEVSKGCTRNCSESLYYKSRIQVCLHSSFLLVWINNWSIGPIFVSNHFIPLPIILRYLLVVNVPSLGVEKDLLKLFALYGPIEE